MYEDFFAQRIAFLRNKKGVSARDMSLSIGQNPSYINNIETRKSKPSLEGFFFIFSAILRVKTVKQRRNRSRG